MNSPIVRCPICREAFETTDEAIGAHVEKHGTWEKLRWLWALDRHSALSAAVAIIAVLLTLAVSVLAVIEGG